jgi:hypothetical protein
VVLAHPEEVDPELISQHRLVHEVAEDLGVRKRVAIGAGGDIPESIEGEFKRGGHGMSSVGGARSTVAPGIHRRPHLRGVDVNHPH